MRGYNPDSPRLRRKRHLSDIATAPYPSGVPMWIDDDTTVQIDCREMRLTAEASMFIDTKLVSRG